MIYYTYYLSVTSVNQYKHLTGRSGPPVGQIFPSEDKLGGGSAWDRLLRKVNWTQYPSGLALDTILTQSIGLGSRMGQIIKKGQLDPMPIGPCIGHRFDSERWTWVPHETDY